MTLHNPIATAPDDDGNVYRFYDDGTQEYVCTEQEWEAHLDSDDELNHLLGGD